MKHPLRSCTLSVLSLFSLASARPAQEAPVLAPEPAANGGRERVDLNGAYAELSLDRPRPGSPTGPGGGQALLDASWVPVGPFGGDIKSIAVSPTDPNIVLAAALSVSYDGRVYRSSDGGDTWEPVPGLEDAWCLDIEFDSAGTAYLADYNELLKSVDGGQTWTQLPLGFELSEIEEITIDSSNDKRIWLGADDGVDGHSLLYTKDRGATWVNRTPPGGPYHITAVALDPTDSDRVYAAWRGFPQGGGVLVSNDGGVTWSDRSAGLPRYPMTDLLHDGLRLLLCGGHGFGGGNVGVWTTADEGVTWTELSGPHWPSRAITDLELGEGGVDHLMCSSLGAGVCESLDGGSTWTFYARGTKGIAGRDLELSSTSVFLGNDNEAVWRGPVGGTNLDPSSDGINWRFTTSVAVNPLNPLELAVSYRSSNCGGVKTSLDGGQTWSDEALPMNRVTGVEFAPDGRLYALVDGPTYTTAEGLYRRKAGSWTNLGPDQGPRFETLLLSVHFDPVDPTVVYLGGRDNGDVGYEAVIWRGSTMGPPWTKVYEGNEDFEYVTDITHVDAGSSRFVAGYRDLSVAHTSGALRSADNGLNWTSADVGLPADVQPRDLSLAPDGSTLVLANRHHLNGGLHQSTDGGLTWTDLARERNTHFVLHHPANGDELVTAHFASPRVRSSADGGATLQDDSGGLDEGARTEDGPDISQRFAAPADGSAFYLATSQGVWVCDNSIGTNFCVAAPNSVGAGALISATGSVSVAANNLRLRAEGLPPSQASIFFYGPQTTQVPYGNGFRCVASGGLGLFLFPALLTSPWGTVSWEVDYGAQQNPLGTILPGSSWHFQLWYRDMNDPPWRRNMSDGLTINFVN